jgi:serine/threonine protein kinase
VASSRAPDGFLEKTVEELAPDLLDEDSGPPPGSLLGPYRIARKLGEGGMGIVYLAEDTRLGRMVALKTLAPTLTAGEPHWERFRREARAAAALSHPGIAAVYALEEIAGALVIAYEYVPGQTLREELAGGPIPAERLLPTALDIARALAAAHGLGIVHRDLKPENVVRPPEGPVKILDFGVARLSKLSGLATTALTEAGTFLGTPFYASPEQLRGEEVDARTDIFSYGVLLYELASGSHPFGSADTTATLARILEAEPPDLATLNPGVPQVLLRVVARCLHKNPDERYPTAQDLVSDLEGNAVAAAPQSGDRVPSRPSSTPPAQAAPRATPLWWWRFHQVVVALLYYLALVPLYLVHDRMDTPWSSLLFFPGLAAAGVAANLRLHLSFTSRFYGAQLRDQLARSAPWIRGADVAFVLLLMVAAGLAHRADPLHATVLLGIAVGSLIGFAVIEPTTTRAALDDEG